MWICGECGEDSEDEFSVCWSCGTGQDGPAASEDLLPVDNTGAESDPSARTARGLFGRKKFAGFRAPAVEPLYTHSWDNMGPLEIRLFDTYLTWHKVNKQEWFHVIPYKSVRHLDWADTGGGPMVVIVTGALKVVVNGSEPELVEFIQRLTPLIS